MLLNWTDQPLAIDITKIRKVHIDEIRAYIDSHIGQHTVPAGGPADLIGNLTHPMASTSNPGFMSAAHYDTVQNFILTGNGIVGVGVTSPLSSTGGSSPTISISPSSSSSAGSMSSTDKAKLDAMTNVPSRLTALEAKPGTGTVTTVSSSTNALSITSSTTTPALTIAEATASNAGLQSVDHFSKVEGMDVALPIGTIIMWHGNRGTHFDYDGRGITEKFLKWCLCNGIEESPDMTESFPLGAGLGGKASNTNTHILAGVGDIPGSSFNTVSNDIIEHRHIVGSFNQAGNNDANFEMQGTVSVPGDYKMKKGGSLPGDSAAGHGPDNDVSLVVDQALVTSKILIDKTPSSKNQNNMPPFKRLWFLYKYKV